MKRRIEARLSEPNIRGKILITGWVNNVQTYLNEMSLLVLPSKTEGLPNILLEAMACKTPVLASIVGAVPSIIKEDETGFLLRSLESDYLAERIIYLSGKPELLRNVSSKAYVWLRENYSAKTASDSWSRVFDSITRAC
jgi:glycosyltransferase involved in cell wall biosynthesis